MKTITISTYTFPELSEKAKDKARQCYHSTYMPDEHWHEFIIENAKEVGKILGFDVDKVYFSGFSSQGDGASWTGGYEYAKGAPAEVASYTGNDAELIRIAHGLQNIQRRHFYKLIASVSRAGYYCHSHTMRADVEDCTDPCRDVSDAEKALLELFRDFADWIYKNLREEYDFMTSDPVIEEAFDANSVTFDADGNIVR